MPVETQHRFNADEFHRMAETGILRPDARVELLAGKILDMSPIGPFHGGVTKRLIRFFTSLANGRWIVSAQDPVHLDDHSEPQPDLMLLKPREDDYTSSHPLPDDVLLLIEVADSSLEFDRSEKLPAYGRAAISEVWILNLPAKTIEIYREPHFTGYGSSHTRRAGDKASPLAFPDVSIDIAQLLKLAR
jgi:Uma2 family endonuclease